MTSAAARPSGAEGEAMPTAQARARVAELLRAATIEVYSKNAPDQLRGALPAGADVYVSFLPGDDVGKRVEIAAAIRAGGYNPVQHVPARQMLDRASLEAYIGAAARDARLRFAA